MKPINRLPRASSWDETLKALIRHLDRLT